jgi:hypothetical protein
VTTVTYDARGGCIRHAYDDAGRLLRLDDLIDGCTGTLEQRAEWRYDSVGTEPGDFDARTAPGRLLRTTVASGSALTTPIERRSWRYDTLGRASHQRTALRDGTPASGTPRLYEEQSTWDQFGRPFQQFFTSYSKDSPTTEHLEFPTHGVLHEYTTGADGYTPGYLRRIRDADGQTQGLIYADILERDAWGNVTREARGRNGTGAAIEITRGHDSRLRGQASS